MLRSFWWIWYCENVLFSLISHHKPLCCYSSTPPLPFFAPFWISLHQLWMYLIAFMIHEWQLFGLVSNPLIKISDTLLYSNNSYEINLFLFKNKKREKNYSFSVRMYVICSSDPCRRFWGHLSVCNDCCSFIALVFHDEI